MSKHDRTAYMFVVNVNNLCEIYLVDDLSCNDIDGEQCIDAIW